MSTVVARHGRSLLVAYGDIRANSPRPPPNAELASVLRWAAAAFRRHCGVVVVGEHAWLWTDELAAVPLYWLANGNLTIATAASALLLFTEAEVELPALGERATLASPRNPGVGGVQAVPARTLVALARRGGRWREDGRRHHATAPPRPRCTDAARARDLVRGLLDRAVVDAVAGGEELWLLLSGGVDSSAVAALAAPRARLRAVTVGSRYGSEIDEARAVADLLGIEHTALRIDADAVQALVRRLVWQLETWCPTTIEIALPQAYALAWIAGNGGKLAVTGYGADLLFGGTLGQHESEMAVEAAVAEQVAAVASSNEISPALGAELGVTVRYPFWEPALVRAALGMRGRLKVGGGEVKRVLRDAVDGLLPTSVARRAKQGIHQGAAIDQLLADTIGAEPRQRAEWLRAVASELFVDSGTANQGGANARAADLAVR
jgi:asparagine synthetase B (glutamine-hydrolysing)